MAVYIIQAQGASDFVKIGFAFDVRKRLLALQTASPFTLKILRVVDGGPSVERMFHERFSEHRHAGEWFHFDENMMIFETGEIPSRAKKKLIYTGPKSDYAIRRYWTDEEKDRFKRLWNEGHSVSEIARRLLRTKGGISRARVQFKFPARTSVFFHVKIKHQRFAFKLPISIGLRRLLRRVDTLQKWFEEGRDDYEISRSFHVPMEDVRAAILGLQLIRSSSAPEPLQNIGRKCKNCGRLFAASQYRFRCDTCVAIASRFDEVEHVTVVNP